MKIINNEQKSYFKSHFFCLNCPLKSVFCHISIFPLDALSHCKKKFFFFLFFITETFLQMERLLGDNQCSTFRAYTVYESVTVI